MSLVELLALRAPSEFLIGTDLNEHFCQLSKMDPSTKNAKSLLRRLLAAAQRFRSTSPPQQRDPVLKAANYNFNTASFNATVALVKTAGLEFKHFTGFIFSENSSNDCI